MAQQRTNGFNRITEQQSSSQQKLHCAENKAQIRALEDLFLPLCQSVSSTATSLVKDLVSQKGPDTSHDAATSQDCILANREAWNHITKQLKCTEVHLKNAAEYQQFFFDAAHYQPWMSSDLQRAADLLKNANLKQGKPQVENIENLLSQIKTVLATMLHWKSKLESLTDRSRRITPVPLRLQKLDYERPALSLMEHKTDDDVHRKIQEGEEVTLIDNSNKQIWKVRTARGEVVQVPSTQLVIQGPDPAATEAASKLRLQFLSDSTNLIKDGGKSVLRLLSLAFKDWSPEEEQMLKSLSPAKKTQIQQLTGSVLQIFSPVWDQYPVFQKLRQKMEKLKQILNERGTKSLPDNDRSTDLQQNILISETDGVGNVVSSFKDWWQNWEQFKILTESLRHPEYLLAVSSSDQFKFMSPEELKKNWQNCLLDFDETDFEETGDLVTIGSSSADEEVYTIETAKEMAETSQLTTSEQEERQTFVITGVIDPRNKEQISLDSAVTLGIINQREGKYVNLVTGESMPIPTAMNAGMIKVEFTRTNKSAEKRSDLGLITIKTFRETRPFTVKTVVDAETEKRMTVDEAIRAGILDLKRGIYSNRSTKEQLSLADALDSGLIAVEFDNNVNDNTNSNTEPECISKTYAIHAVIDARTKARKTFSEAVASDLIDPRTGAYFNKLTGEYIYIGDAIKSGLVKATVVHDSNTLNIAPANRIMLPDANMETFQLRAQGSLERSHVNGMSNDLSNGSSNGQINGRRY